MNIDDVMHPADPAMVTEQQVAAAFGIVLAVGEAIRDLGSVPSGHLYVRLMGRLDIHQYNAVIGKLKQCGLVEEEGHMLRWIGPKGGGK